MASQITSFQTVYSTVYSGVDQRKHLSSAPLALWCEEIGEIVSIVYGILQKESRISSTPCSQSWMKWIPLAIYSTPLSKIFWYVNGSASRRSRNWFIYYIDHYVIMGAMATQITGDSIAYSAVCSGAGLKETQKFRVTGLCAGIYCSPVNSPHKGPVTLHLMTSSCKTVHSPVANETECYVLTTFI